MSYSLCESNSFRRGSVESGLHSSRVSEAAKIILPERIGLIANIFLGCGASREE